MSELLKELKTLSSHKLIYSLALISALIAPGLLMIFLYQRELFISTGVIKLLLLSVSLSMPTLLLSMVLSKSDSDNQSFDEMTFYGYVINLLLFYPSLFTTYLMELRFSGFVVLFCGLWFGTLVISVIDKRHRKGA